MADRVNEASAIYLVGYGSFQEPRLIELQYHRIMRYIEARDDNTESSPDIFVDLGIPRRSGQRTLDQLPNLRVLRDRASSYTRIFIDIEDRDFDNVSALVREALEGRGPKLLNVFYDDEKVMDRKLKQIHGSARVHDLTDGSDFTNLFNHANVAEINPVFGSGLAPMLGFGQPIEGTAARQIQFSLDFEF